MSDPPPRLSQSIAKVLLAKGPFHAWHYHRKLGGLRFESDAMDGGTLIHELSLGGDKIDILEFKDWRTDAAKDARSESRAEGRTPVLQKTVDKAQPTVKAIRRALAGYGIEPGATGWHIEERLQWEQDGVPCEGTPDVFGEYVGFMFAMDLKTVGKGIEPDRLHATAAMEWAIQRAAYTFALEILFPEWAGRTRWMWLLAEPKAPHQVRWAEADWALRELGERQWMRAVKWWGELLDLGWKEPWAAGPFTLAAPMWALTKEEEYGESEDEKV